MSEPRKNHLNIDGAQVKEDDHAVASYKPILESDTAEFRASRSSLGKSKEKISTDGAEERLLTKEDEAKIVTTVNMADAKYVVEDHRNGDAKIELDANKRQFSGLTKEELLKYAEDPFWVRLRWFMFILFWSLWLCMLVGAIVIIVYAPKCALPTPKTWYEKGPLVDASSVQSYKEVMSLLPHLKQSKVKGIFVQAKTYEVLEDASAIDQFKALVAAAKIHGVNVIVDLTANFVSKSHSWFAASENRTAPYDDFFIWGKDKGYTNDGKTRIPPSNWRSTMDTSAWEWSERRGEFFLQQHAAGHPDLKLTNPLLVRIFDGILQKYMLAGASGVRLLKARSLVVNPSFADEDPATGRGSQPNAGHDQYAFWRHKQTSDQPALDDLIAHWSKVVDGNCSLGIGQSVFTVKEEGDRTELYLLDRNAKALASLRPRSAAAVNLQNITRAVEGLNKKLGKWPALQLTSVSGDLEVSSLSLLLPAAPVLSVEQLPKVDNTTGPNEMLSHLVELRNDASIENGNYSIVAVPSSAGGHMLACARWKVGHTGYVGVYNPHSSESRANLTQIPHLADWLTLHHVSHYVKQYLDDAKFNHTVSSGDVLVPPASTLVLSYVPKTTVEQ